MTTNNLITSPIIQEAIKLYTKTKLDDRWDQFIATSEKPQSEYRKFMRAWFNNQADDVLSRLTKAIKSEYDAEQIDWDRYRLQLNEFGQLELPGIMTAWASLELEALEVGVSFDVTLPEVTTAINSRANLFSDSVVNETRDALHKVIINGIDNGYGIPQFEKAIRQLYTNMSKYRSTRIARTEVIWAQNEGAEQSYIQSQVVAAKKWWTARDERRCPFCASMHGKEIGIGENYFSIGDSLEVPKPEKGLKAIEIDTTHGKFIYEFYHKYAKADTIRYNFNYEDIRHPPLHPHCRCVLIAVLTEMTLAYRNYIAYKWLTRQT